MASADMDSTVKLRAATYADIKRIAETTYDGYCATVDFESHRPGHQKDPDDVKTAIRHDFWKMIQCEGYVIMVAEKNSTAVGVAVWLVNPTWRQYAKLKEQMQDFSIRMPTLGLYDEKHISRHHSELYNETIEPYLEDEKHRCLNWWRLKMLVVDPAHWGQGCGSLLIRWGMNHADTDEDKVTLLLEATEKGAGLYKELDWRKIIEVHCDGDDIAPKGITGHIMRHQRSVVSEEESSSEMSSPMSTATELTDHDIGLEMLEETDSSNA